MLVATLFASGRPHTIFVWPTTIGAHATCSCGAAAAQQTLAASRHTLEFALNPFFYTLPSRRIRAPTSLISGVLLNLASAASRYGSEL